MQITPDHVEWAVVDRMRSMISALPETSHEVTLTYALLNSIPCWVIHHSRRKVESKFDKLACRLWNTLSSMDLSGDQLSAVARRTDPPQEIPGKKLDIDNSMELNDLSCAWVLVAMRNSLAHGDDAVVGPWNQGKRLRGFRVRLNVKELTDEGAKTEKIVWYGELELSQVDMAQLGIFLADCFLGVAEPLGKEKYGRQFPDDAMQVSEERRAA